MGHHDGLYLSDLHPGTAYLYLEILAPKMHETAIGEDPADIASTV